MVINRPGLIRSDKGFPRSLASGAGMANDSGDSRILAALFKSGKLLLSFGHL
jgi:hypothetical protein